MALNSSVEQIVVDSRADTIAKYKRDYMLRDPNATSVVFEQVDILASVVADQLLPIQAAAKAAGNALTRQNQSGTDLDEAWAPRGIPRLKANGASGFVELSASSLGCAVFEGDELKDLNDNTRYRATIQYLAAADKQAIAIVAVDTGVRTNKPVGTVLYWSKSRPGRGAKVTVLDLGNGKGLTGGREVETDEEYNRRIDDAQANPRAAANAADVIGFVEGLRDRGIPVQKAFIYPAVLGSCTLAIAATVKDIDGDGAPNEAQRAQIEEFTTEEFPAGDIMYFPTVLLQTQDLVVEVKWAKSVPGWADNAPWPKRYAAGSGQIVAGAVTSSTQFVLQTDNGVYSGVAGPQVGNTIGFYDRSRKAFSRKKIESVSGTGPWTVVCATTLGASDTSFTPVTGDPCCPWSDSLDSLVLPFSSAFDQLGPGEMFANAEFFDDGIGRKRYPDSNDEYPAALTIKNLNASFSIPSVTNVDFFEGADAVPSIGAPGALVYRLSPGNITGFPKNS